MTEPKNGRPIFFPRKLVLYGNIALAVWIILDTAAFLLFDLWTGIAFFIAMLINLWCTTPNRLPATMLQLHKMHSRHGTISSIIFWQTNLQRLQIQLQTTNCNILHFIIGAFPAAFALYSTIQNFTIIKATIFVVLLTITIFSGLTWRTKKQ